MKRLSDHFTRWVLPVLAVLAALATLVGCGGTATPTPTPTTTPSGPNAAPVIDKILPEWSDIERGKSGLLKVIAHDPDGDALNYEWSVDRGSLSGTGDTVTYSAPLSYVEVVATVTIRDGRGGVVTGGVKFEVVCCGHAMKNPEWVDESTPGV